MRKEALLDELIARLCAERGESVPHLEYGEKHAFFRALCNVRPPDEISEDFLKLQDEYLTILTAERGIVKTAGLEYRGNIALWQGDITRLDAGAIVNAGNSALLGCFRPLHNCIDNIIHSNAGVQLRLECARLTRGISAANGSVTVTQAYNLPCRYVFHTVGPEVRGSLTETDRADLRKCYISCMDTAAKMGLECIAFCCVSTGVFGFPKEEACRIAVSAVKDRLKEGARVKVVFDVYTDEDRAIYERELRYQDSGSR